MNKDKEQYLSNLKGLVNDKKQHDAFIEYLDYLINVEHKALEQGEGVAMHRSQGAIGVLRRLKSIRNEVNGTG